MPDRAEIILLCGANIAIVAFDVGDKELLLIRGRLVVQYDFCLFGRAVEGDVDSGGGDCGLGC